MSTNPTNTSPATGDSTIDHPHRATTSVAVLGLGAMGSRISARIAEAGFDLTVWNRSPDTAHGLATMLNETRSETAGAETAGSETTRAETTRSETTGVRAAATIADALRNADVVVSMVADDHASRALWLDPANGALSAMRPTAVAVEASTITRTMATELSREARDRGVAMLEAPVVGSRPQAEAGALLSLIGGDEAVLDRARPVIEAYSGAVRPVGAVGNAATMKLAINGLFGIQVAAYAEIVGLLAGSEVDTDTAIEILTGLPITSPGLQRILGLFADRAFEPNFPVALVAKDFDYLRTLADQLAADTPISAAAGAVYRRGAGGDPGRPGPQAELDIAGIVTRYLD